MKVWIQHETVYKYLRYYGKYYGKYYKNLNNMIYCNPLLISLLYHDIMSTSIAEYIKSSFNKPDLSDLTIYVGDKQIFVHKYILANSNYFKTTFTTSAPVTHKYPDNLYDALLQILGTLYGYELNVTKDNFFEIIELQEMFELPNIRQNLLTWLRNNISDLLTGLEMPENTIIQLVNHFEKDNVFKIIQDVILKFLEQNTQHIKLILLTKFDFLIENLPFDLVISKIVEYQYYTGFNKLFFKRPHLFNKTKKIWIPILQSQRLIKHDQLSIMKRNILLRVDDKKSHEVMGNYVEVTSIVPLNATLHRYVGNSELKKSFYLEPYRGISKQSIVKFHDWKNGIHYTHKIDSIWYESGYALDFETESVDHAYPGILYNFNLEGDLHQEINSKIYSLYLIRDLHV